MTGLTDAENGRPLQQPVVLPVMSARHGVEHLVADEAMTAGFACATRPASVPFPDITLAHGDRAPETAGPGSVVDALVLPRPVHRRTP